MRKIGRSASSCRRKPELIMDRETQMDRSTRIFNRRIWRLLLIWSIYTILGFKVVTAEKSKISTSSSSDVKVPYEIEQFFSPSSAIETQELRALLPEVEHISSSGGADFEAFDLYKETMETTEEWQRNSTSGVHQRNLLPQMNTGLWNKAGQTGTSVNCALFPKTLSAMNRRHWLTMVYLHADNDLDLPAVVDTNEMLNPTIDRFSQNQHLLVLIDRSAWKGHSALGPISVCPELEYTSSMQPWEVFTRFTMAYLLLRMRLSMGRYQWLFLEQWGEVDMNSTTTLQNFVSYGLKNYDAEHTALILWNHGSAWFGFGDDKDNEDRRPMTVSEMKLAITNGIAESGKSVGYRLSLLGYDACLMSSLEVLQGVHSLAHYFLAAEENVPNHGWNYRRLVTSVMDQGKLRSATAFEYGTAILRGFAEYMVSPLLSLSLIELKYFDLFDHEYSVLLSKIYACGGPRVAAVVQRAMRAANNIPGCLMIGMCSCVDMISFLGRLVENFGSFSGVSFIYEQVQRVRDAFRAMIAASCCGSAKRIYSGISLYFPDAQMDVTCHRPLTGRIYWHAYQQTMKSNHSSFLSNVDKGVPGAVCYPTATRVDSSDKSPTVNQNYYLSGLVDENYAIKSYSVEKIVKWHRVYYYVTALARAPASGRYLGAAVTVEGIKTNAALLPANTFNLRPNALYISSIGLGRVEDSDATRDSQDSLLKGWWDATVWIATQYGVKGGKPSANSRALLTAHISKQSSQGSSKHQLLLIPVLIFETETDVQCLGGAPNTEVILGALSTAGDTPTCGEEGFLKIYYDSEHSGVARSLHVRSGRTTKEWDNGKPAWLRFVARQWLLGKTSQRRNLTRVTFQFDEAAANVFRDSYLTVPMKNRDSIIRVVCGSVFVWNDPKRAPLKVRPLSYARLASILGNEIRLVHAITSKLPTVKMPRSLTFAVSSETSTCLPEYINDGICDPVCAVEEHQLDGQDCPVAPTNSANDLTVDLRKPVLGGPCTTAMCDYNSTCIPNGATYTCECDSGFRNHGMACIDIDECQEKIAKCHPEAKCINTIGSFQCICNEGLIGDGETTCEPIRLACLDKDGLPKCSFGLHCLNDGKCGCASGYRLSPTGICADVDECEEGLASCGNNSQCFNQVAGYLCSCNSGYDGDGRICGEAPVTVHFDLVIAKAFDEVISKHGGVAAFKKFVKNALTEALVAIMPATLIRIEEVIEGSVVIKLAFRGDTLINPITKEQNTYSAGEALRELQAQHVLPDSKWRTGTFAPYALLASVENWEFVSRQVEERTWYTILFVEWLPKAVQRALPVWLIICVQLIIFILLALLVIFITRAAFRRCRNYRRRSTITPETVPEIKSNQKNVEKIHPPVETLTSPSPHR